MPSRSKHWVAATGVVAALALVGAGCGDDSDDDGGSGGGKGGKIAFLLPESKTTRYEQQDRPNFVRRVGELCPDCEVIYENAQQDPAKQQQQAEAAITQGAKVLVLDAVDVKSAAGIATRAKQQDIPVISYSRLVSDADLDYYVSIDPYAIGQQQGRALVEALGGGKGKRVVMINGAPTDSNAGPYKKGAHSILDRAGVRVVKEYDTPDWSPDKAQSEMEQAITAVGKDGFDGVYVANDGMATGAIAALKGADIDPGKVPVTGQDAELGALQRILAGEQLMTVYQPIKKMAETAAALAVPLAQDSKPPAIARAKVDNGGGQVPSVLLDSITVTTDNIQDTVVEDGFYTADKICTAPYAKACEEAGIR